MEITWIRTLFQLFTIVGVSVGSLQFTVVVPKTIYYDSPTVASVSAYGVESNSQATLTLQYKGKTGNILESTNLTFTSDGSQNWTVTFTWEGNGEKTVELVMRSGQDSNNITNTCNLTFADNFGYIFVQTDKPVYVPGQTVKYRVIAVDEQQRQARYKMRIDIKNPQQTIIERRPTTAGEAFKTQELTLPKEASTGNWSITASFEGTDNMPRNAQTVTFEVKDFVLPRYSTQLSINPKVITNETKNTTVMGVARYYFNRGVNGTADVQLGTWDNDNGLKFKKTLSNLKLINGSFTEVVQVDKLQINWQRLPKNMRLYVKMVITDTVTGEVDKFEDTSTFISHPDYIVEFAGSKGFFRPGFNYMLQIQVMDIIKQPASEINISIATEFQIGRDIKKSIHFETLDRHGKKLLNITVPDNAVAITFLVSVANSKDFKHTVKKYDSKSNEYIHISLASPIEDSAVNTSILLLLLVLKRKPGSVKLEYTKPAKEDQNVGDSHDNVTVLVVSKGHIVFTISVVKKSGGIFVQLPVHLYSIISPRMRIIAYYYLPSKQEYIIDSLVDDTKHVCVEELSLSHQGSLYTPNTNLKIEVDGGPGMRVGLVAVDTAVFALSRDGTHTLNRNMMFKKLGSHDSGTESGDGDSMKNILSNSGLQHLSLTVKPIYTIARDYQHSHGRGDFLSEPLMGRSFQRKSFNRSYKKGDHSQADKREAVQQHLQTQDQSSPEQKQEDPPQTVRNYFPESWLFEDFELPSNGAETLSLTLPSSITTWSFLAVGMSSTRGICVSEPEEVMVTKLFFADIKLPRKVKRLEKVTMHIVLYNNNHYNLTVNVTVNGSDGLCFLDSPAASGNEIPVFQIHIQHHDFYKKTLQFIPMRIGDLKVFVDLQLPHVSDRDAVEKSLQVVAEGQKVKKSITFVLDPKAKNASVKSMENRNSATVKNMYDPENKQQNTTINLSLPVEAIKGTEVCRISAFGDLMGDIINHSVLESKKLIDNTMGAEEILSDLAPTVYALLYANDSGLMNEKLRNRSRAFVRNGVVSLLGYRRGDKSFALTPRSNSSTWLTAFVLKTLCQASSLAVIDQESIIDPGFQWLAKQVNNETGIADEQDWRLAKDSLEYRIMLSAEVLIAILECHKSEEANLLTVQGALYSFLEGEIDKIKEPMVLAKVTYAFMLSEDSKDEYINAKEKLKSKRKKDKQDNIFWSSVEETNESKQSVWYDNGTQASAIEATAYALIIYLDDGDPDAEAIADWLVGQRNPNGAFIGAMDSAVAIQALAKYSYQKHGMKVDLCCNVSSDIHKSYFHSFKFTGENATHQKSLNNVPVGQVLDVQTKGQGLGQMQINVEYNIPIDKNKKCPLRMVQTVTITNIYPTGGVNSNPLCESCNIGCAKRNPRLRTNVRVSKSVIMNLCKRKQLPYQEEIMCKSLQVIRKRSSEKKEKRKQARKNKQGNRGNRSVREYQTFSKKSICIKLCFQRRKREPSYPTGVNIEMLTGYKPVVYDIDKLKELPNVKQVVFDNTTETLRVQFTEISNRRQTCLAFRAVEEEEVDRLLPAVVEVKKPGTNTPLCVFDYHPPAEEESLQTYCAKNINGDKRECKCFSGQCAINREHAELSNLNELKNMVCASNIVYQLQFNNNSSSESCDEIDAEVISLNKTGKDSITVQSKVKLSKSSFCTCPKHRQDSSETIYVLGSTVEKHVDIQGHEVNRHIIDEKSTFLQFAGESDNRLSTSNWLFQQAIKSCHG